MLKERQLDFEYREYTKDPLSLTELRELFAKLPQRPGELLRKRDPARKELGLKGDEPDDVLLTHMAAHPTLLQRPIFVLGEKAVVGRPVERLDEIL